MCSADQCKNQVAPYHKSSQDLYSTRGQYNLSQSIGQPMYNNNSTIGYGGN